MLRDVGGEFAVCGRVDRGGVEEESAVGGGYSGSENVEESGFSSAARANDGQDLGRIGGEGDVFEDVSGWV